MSSDGERRRWAKTKKRRLVVAHDNGSSDECDATPEKTRRNSTSDASPSSGTTTRSKDDGTASSSRNGRVLRSFRASNDNVDGNSSSTNVATMQREKTTNDSTAGKHRKSTRSTESPEIVTSAKEPTKKSESIENITNINRAETSDHCCPICLATFTSQEVGTPTSCNHYFCLRCITEWSNSTNTCPVDRQRFDAILVRERYGGKVTNRQEITSMRYQQYSPGATSSVSNNDSNSDDSTQIWAEYISEISHDSEEFFFSTDEDSSILFSINEPGTEDRSDDIYEDEEEDEDDEEEEEEESQNGAEEEEEGSSNRGDDNADAWREESISGPNEMSPNGGSNSSVATTYSPYYDDVQYDGNSHQSEVQTSPSASLASNDTEDAYRHSDYSQTAEDFPTGATTTSISPDNETSWFENHEFSDTSGSSFSFLSARYSAESYSSDDSSF